MMLSDIGEYLQTKGVGTIGKDIFVGCFPKTPDNCLALLDFEGLSENRQAGIQMPGLRLAARWKEDYLYAPEILNAAHSVLKQIGYEENNETASGVIINGRQYFHVWAAFSGFEPMEPDEDGRMYISKNYYIAKEEE